MFASAKREEKTIYNNKCAPPASAGDGLFSFSNGNKFVSHFFARSFILLLHEFLFLAQFAWKRRDRGRKRARERSRREREGCITKSVDVVRVTVTPD